MICKICKTNNEQDSQFCISCGSPLTQKTKTCQNGHIYDSSLSICPYCPSAALQDRLGQVKSNDITSTFSSGASKTKIMPDAGKSKKTIIVNADNEDGLSNIASGRKIVGWLITFTWHKEGEDFKIYEGRNMISSAVDADIQLNDPAVSDPHCMILFRMGKIIIKDELSTNGTYLNGNLIEESELKDNDIIKVGTTELKLRTV